MVQPAGTYFGADFVSANIHKPVNGTLTAASFGCTTDNTGYQAVSGQLASIPAMLALQRITSPLGLPACQ